MSGHLVSHILNPDLQSDNTLHVIGVCSNVVRWHSRYRLARQWIKEMQATQNVVVHVVEAVFKDRKPELESSDYSYLKVKTDSEIWLKENLINLGVKHLLPKDWKYMAWVDMDVAFRNPSWALDTVHQLQHYNLLQPWSHASDLDFHGGHLNNFTSFGFLVANRKPVASGKDTPYQYGHTGFAWACTRYWYENVEKLLDFSILGAGDHTMAWATIGDVERAINQRIGDGYKSLCNQWSAKSEMAAAKLVGYVHGRIEHAFHGHKENRKYWGRWDILIDNGFNPITDVAYDSQGVLILCGANKYKLEQDIMIYNRQRNEDAV
jgi:hypothetical protein